MTLGRVYKSQWIPFFFLSCQIYRPIDWCAKVTNLTLFRDGDCSGTHCLSFKHPLAMTFGVDKRLAKSQYQSECFMHFNEKSRKGLCVSGHCTNTMIFERRGFVYFYQIQFHLLILIWFCDQYFYILCNNVSILWSSDFSLRLCLYDLAISRRKKACLLTWMSKCQMIFTIWPCSILWILTLLNWWIKVLS